MDKKPDAERFLRVVLIINGIGDIGLGAFMLFLPGQLARMVNFDLTGEMIYLVGGWGTASMSFGVMRLFAGIGARPEIRWFVAAFGLFEGTLLTVFGLAVMALTPLTFSQVSLSTLFALFFAVAYGLAFLWRGTSAHDDGTAGQN
jgi:ABC-type transport system involved in cytochrome c biogenesis permease subunit